FKRSEDFVSIPPKENVKAGLATLGLTDKNDTSLSSSGLINSSLPAEEPVVTADITQSLGAFELAEEQGNQPETADNRKVQKSIDKEVVKESGIESLGDIPLEDFGEADANVNADESSY
nr:hypothetical protein [Tanacetum cinerariifolium]